MEKSCYVMLVFDKKAYFYAYESECVYPYLIKNRILMKAVIKVARGFHLALPSFLVKKSLFDCSFILFTETVFNEPLLKCLKKHSSGPVRFQIYYMNTISEASVQYLKYFKNAYTFDHKEAEKYGLHYLHTPYSSKIGFHDRKYKYDALFLGRGKNRMEEILKARDILEKNQIKAKFMVLGTDIKDISIDKFISYQEYLSYLEESRCIIEINKPGQCGCSLRLLESVFFKKKIITNNSEAKMDPYVSPENVYVLGEDNSDLNSFIHSPFVEKNRCSSAQIDFTNWIKSIG